MNTPNENNTKNKWLSLINSLYSLITPIKGEIHHRFTQFGGTSYGMKDLWIELDIKGFDYEDPNYGWVEGDGGTFGMSIDLRFAAKHPLISKSIFDLENTEHNLQTDEWIGTFSNTISFIVPKIKFGKIENNKIACELEYILIDDVQNYVLEEIESFSNAKKGILKLELKVQELKVVVPLKEDEKIVFPLIDQEFYNLDTEGITIPDFNPLPDYKLFIVPFRK